MKKWNNPELLNLMVQETKENEVESKEGERIIFHTCKKNEKTHTHAFGYCTEGHGKVEFNGLLQEDFCCVSAS